MEGNDSQRADSLDPYFLLFLVKGDQMLLRLVPFFYGLQHLTGYPFDE